ncbi:MAG: molybdopterin-dependent oxidoreductase [Bacteroidia bacterium]|nr:molybdopterin-dependent oxidoreductase [Bacteroidia bacterium]
MNSNTPAQELRKETTFCRICESLCGLEVTLRGDQIESILPDPNHVATRGFACPKGLKQHKMFASPDRLLYPMKRTGKDWNRISWEQSMQEIGAKVAQIRKEHGPDAIAMYVGTAAGLGALHPVFAQGFMDAVGSGTMFASASQDCSNKFAVSNLMYGFPFLLTFPDLKNTDCLIIAGANPVVSKWSFLQVPNPIAHLKEMERRGGKVFVLDPRKTETAKVAGQHVFIRPNTDVFFFLSFLHELEKAGGIRPGWEEHMKGAQPILELARQWPAERTEEVTQVPADTLREMVHAYMNAKSASIYSSTGVNMGANGSLAFWVKECINALSGNLDKAGGSLVSRGVIDFPKFGKKNGLLVKQDRSRVGNLGKVNDAFPGGILADEILTEGKGKIRALFVTGGNPLITMANANRLREAFQNLDLLVTLDIYPNETGTVGHYMLPCTSPLERPDLPFIFPLMLGLQTKPYLQGTEAILPPPGEVRDEATIYLDICKAAGVNMLGSGIAQKLLELGRWNASRKKKPGEQPGLPQKWILSALLRVSRQGSFSKLLKSKHGRLLGEHQPGSFLGKRVLTEDGKVNLSPEALIQQAAKLEQDFAWEKSTAGQLKLITKRAVTTHNSWTHNIDEFVSGERFTNYLYMHPLDADRLGLADKQLVDVASATGKVRLPVKLLTDLMPGTVALPHGWGHQSTHMQVARATQGVNVNILAADGPEHVEKVSGMVHLTGIPVEVTAAAGPLAENSWSGLPEDVLEVGQFER